MLTVLLAYINITKESMNSLIQRPRIKKLSHQEILFMRPLGMKKEKAEFWIKLSDIKFSNIRNSHIKKSCLNNI